MDVTVIIVSYNTKDLTLNCLRSLYEKTRYVTFEVVVVDNASTDGSLQAIQAEFPQVKLIENSSNLGFGAANNRGIAASDSKYIFLLNSDTLLVNNAVKVLYDVMNRDEFSHVGICGGSLFTEGMRSHLSYGHFPSLGQVLFEFCELHHLFKAWYVKSFQTIVVNQNESIRKVDYVSGAGMFIRRAALIDAGMFDEDFFLYYEETELSYRFKRKGYSSLIVPKAQIIHLSSLDVVYDEKKMAIIEKSRYIFFLKCYGNTVAKFVKYLYLTRYTLRAILTGNVRYRKAAKLVSCTWR